MSRSAGKKSSEAAVWGKRGQSVGFRGGGTSREGSLDRVRPSGWSKRRILGNGTPAHAASFDLSSHSPSSASRKNGEGTKGEDEVPHPPRLGHPSNRPFPIGAPSTTGDSRGSRSIQRRWDRCFELRRGRERGPRSLPRGRMWASRLRPVALDDGRGIARGPAVEVDGCIGGEEGWWGDVWTENEGWEGSADWAKEER